MEQKEKQMTICQWQEITDIFFDHDRRLLRGRKKMTRGVQKKSQRKEIKVKNK
jgi:hypothetical protein